MAILDKLFGDTNNKDNNTNNNTQSKTSDEGTLKLRKEELDINKNNVQVGEVSLSKEVVEDQQTVNVPVMHEEVVIERRPISNSDSSSDATISSDNNETITIPVSEEKVDVGKHTVVTEEISAFKRQVEDSQEINETLKREEAKIDKNGNVEIVSEENKPSGGLQ
jgi:uncharacterized protein (TIGR02271 family)